MIPFYTKIAISYQLSAYKDGLRPGFIGLPRKPGIGCFHCSLRTPVYGSLFEKSLLDNNLCLSAFWATKADQNPCYPELLSRLFLGQSHKGAPKNLLLRNSTIKRHKSKLISIVKSNK